MEDLFYHYLKWGGPVTITDVTTAKKAECSTLPFKSSSMAFKLIVKNEIMFVFPIILR